MVLVAASDLLDFHLHRLSILLLQCGQLGLHVGGILTSVVVHLLLHLLVLLILILRTLHHWRQLISVVGHCIGRQCAPLTLTGLFYRILLLLLWILASNTVLVIDLHHVNFG